MTVLGAAGVVPLPLPPGLIRGAALLGAGVLLLRGLEGYVDARLRPASKGTPFERLDRLVFSPLCLALALITWASAR